MKIQTIQQFFKQFPSDEACLEHLMKVRYGLKGFCPSCGAETNFSRVSSQRAYACQWCGWHTYPCVGTPFESSRTSLQLWFYAIYLFTMSRHGVPAKELQRQLGVTYKCAHRMGHKIREHMGFVDGDFPLGGDVEIDETLIGGHAEGQEMGRSNKTVLMGMMQRGGDVMLQVVPNIKRKTLFPIIAKNVLAGSVVHTDECRSYIGLRHKGYTHKTVNHGEKEYVKGDSHVNSMESFWARLKTSINGTHIHVSGKHLDKYAEEFEYRFNSRNHPEKGDCPLLDWWHRRWYRLFRQGGVLFIIMAVMLAVQVKCSEAFAFNNLLQVANNSDFETKLSTVRDIKYVNVLALPPHKDVGISICCIGDSCGIQPVSGCSSASPAIDSGSRTQNRGLRGESIDRGLTKEKILDLWNPRDTYLHFHLFGWRGAGVLPYHPETHRNQMPILINCNAGLGFFHKDEGSFYGLGQSLLALAKSCQNNGEPSDNNSCQGGKRPLVLVNKIPNTIAVVSERDMENGETFFKGLFAIVVIAIIYAGLKRW